MTKIKSCVPPLIWPRPPIVITILRPIHGIAYDFWKFYPRLDCYQHAESHRSSPTASPQFYPHPTRSPTAVVPVPTPFPPPLSPSPLPLSFFPPCPRQSAKLSPPKSHQTNSYSDELYIFVTYVIVVGLLLDWHKPTTIISFDLIPQCDGRTDGQTAQRNKIKVYT